MSSGIPEWMKSFVRFERDGTPVRTYPLDEWLEKLDREMPLKGYVKTALGWERRRS